MKNLTIISILILLSTLIMAKDNFKEGNKLYFEKKYDEAINEYNEFLKKNPDYYEGYYNAGNAFFRKGEYEKALDMYKKALEFKQDDDIKHNIKVTEEKLKEKQKQDQNQKSQNFQQKNQQEKKQAESDDKRENKGQQSKNNKENQNNKQLENNQQSTNNNQQKAKPNMSDDEIQAMLNMMQKQEKQLRQYFGQRQKNNRNKDDFNMPDFFNMTPDEIMEYMQKKMLDPFDETIPRRKRGNQQEKDW